MLVDVHCHLDYEEAFKNDLDEVIERAKKAGVVAMISNGISAESNRKVLEICRKYPIIKPALGIYPEYAVQMSDEEIEKEIAFIKKSKPIAIGEVGLDGYRVPNPKRQKEVFRRFVELAKQMNIPVIVHSRKMEQEVFDILSELEPKKAVVHCFCGSIELAKKIEAKNWCFSIPPKIVRDKGFQELVQTVQNTHLLTETDAPFLAPAQDTRNEPAFIAEAVKKIAEIKKIEVQEAENIIFMNYKRLFG